MKRRLKKIILAAAALGVGGWLLGGLWMRSWIAKPPPLPADLSITKLQPEQRDGKTWLGQSWVTRREGLRVIRLKVPPSRWATPPGNCWRRKCTRSRTNSS